MVDISKKILLLTQWVEAARSFSHYPKSPKGELFKLAWVAIEAGQFCLAESFTNEAGLTLFTGLDAATNAVNHILSGPKIDLYKETLPSGPSEAIRVIENSVISLGEAYASPFTPIGAFVLLNSSLFEAAKKLDLVRPDEDFSEAALLRSVQAFRLARIFGRGKPRPINLELLKCD